MLGQGRLALCCARQEVVQTVQKPLKFPHASLDMVVDISVVAQRQFPLGLAIQQTIEISQLRLIDKVLDDFVVQQVPRVLAWRRQSSPTVQLVLVLGCRRGEDGRDSTIAAR